MSAKADSVPAGVSEADLPDIAALQPAETLRRRWPSILAAVLSLAMLVMLGRELLDTGVAGLSKAAPDSPWFYIAFTGLYLAAPTGDFVIFRRLWQIPWAGFGALHKKRIANDVVLGYSGEAYFYAWARARANLVAAPFGAVKDVSLLSAIAGNGATIILCAIALPVGYQLMPRGVLNAVVGSAVITLAVSLLLILFSKRVFSLPRRQLWEVFWIHCARIAASSLLLALAWHYAMPEVSLWMWVFLSAARLLVSRLPLVPNKDLLFASFAILLIGRGEALSEMIAFVAGLTLVVHLALVLAFALGAGFTGLRHWRR
ncbi:hypothetical protein [Sphingomonas mucosissima]|uniref:Flippase-like domain-containing protein n=1 Tax=Sphingomonas mucosissima TaxID=370959 RepID=A0A245ZHA0_9SPHN|nr:hypothetical protein [Sphingomonas mucosissima]OWK29119.1 hypothetical protein SPMU_26460 [Sphingomonas mucosissima]